MNLVEVKQLIKVEKLLKEVLTGKVERLPQAKQAKKIISNMVEFKNIGAWKEILDED